VLRRELIDPKIAEHHGHIVKTTGDGMLVPPQPRRKTIFSFSANVEKGSDCWSSPPRGEGVICRTFRSVMLGAPLIQDFQAPEMP
jgi:class 3 adenylate cyclase